MEVTKESDVAGGPPLCGSTALEVPGLCHATLNNGERVAGASKKRLRKENKERRLEKQRQQPRQSYWTEHRGQFNIPLPKQAPTRWRGDMCPFGLALYHPAAASLLQYATNGCPVMPGRDWTYDEIEAVVLH